MTKIYSWSDYAQLNQQSESNSFIKDLTRTIKMLEAKLRKLLQKVNQINFPNVFILFRTIWRDRTRESHPPRKNVKHHVRPQTKALQPK